MLVKLKDGCILRIDYDHEESYGCPTCGYGGYVLNTFEIYLSARLITLYLGNPDNICTESDLMKYFMGLTLGSMTEDDLIDDLYKHFEVQSITNRPEEQPGANMMCVEEPENLFCCNFNNTTLEWDVIKMGKGFASKTDTYPHFDYDGTLILTCSESTLSTALESANALFLKRKEQYYDFHMWYESVKDISELPPIPYVKEDSSNC